MIAPLREQTVDVVENPRNEQLDLARRYIAATLLKPGTAQPAPPPVPRWQAWLLVCWMVFITTTYGVLMARLWTP